MATKKDVKEISEIKKKLELNSLLKIVSILFILSITVLAIVNIFERKEGKEVSQNVITVSGHSELNVKPDTTKFTISVTETGDSVKSSQDAATNKINSAISILRQNGVPDKNIKTLSYNTYPKYSTRTAPCGNPATSVSAPVKGKTPVISNSSSVKIPPSSTVSSKTVSGVATTRVNVGSTGSVGVGAPAGITQVCTDKTSEIIGYETSQVVEVKITDISKSPDLAGTLVSSVGKVGVQVSGLNSYVDNLDMIKQIIRDQAIQKAKIQAKEIAEALGVRLGKVTAFSENSGGGYPYPLMMSAKSVGSADSIAPSLPVGEDLISSDISVSYSIR
ncbi:MAG: SIMPL domain-containing protein [bacterium]